MYDLQRSAAALPEFMRLFGMRPGAYLRRDQYADLPDVNQSFKGVIKTRQCCRYPAWRVSNQSLAL
jgi:hypothetical protein